ncbi:MAG: THUMP domain-containing class I SAM-dependent RNA methyltransferase, partial [Planctomycetaceae bacterium]
MIELIATTSFGLEAVVARELRRLGYERQTTEDGRVRFTADEAAICRANLHLRSAERVLLKLGEFEARDFGELFDQTVALPWAEWLPADAAFPVRGRSVKSQLASVPNCQSIVKKAIAESLTRSHRRVWFEETGPEFAVEVSILKDRVTLSIDTSGRGLHKRGYRKLVGPSPLRETLAAALVQLSYWNAGRPLIDPFCGSGTIAIEAALLGRDMAPGLGRSFAAERWPRIADTLWTEVRSEARDSIQDRPLSIIGTDSDADVLRLARHHAREAGVEDAIHFQQQPLAEFTTKRPYGCIICNPPYGERSGDRNSAEAIYREMARVFAPLETWSIYVITSHPEFERLFARRADRRRKLYNGRMECTYYQFYGPRPPLRINEKITSAFGGANSLSPGRG